MRHEKERIILSAVHNKKEGSHGKRGSCQTAGDTTKTRFFTV
jgi:hypothetical protein